jgi:hypothetical protein
MGQKGLQGPGWHQIVGYSAQPGEGRYGWRHGEHQPATVANVSERPEGGQPGQEVTQPKNAKGQQVRRFHGRPIPGRVVTQPSM